MLLKIDTASQNYLCTIRGLSSVVPVLQSNSITIEEFHHSLQDVTNFPLRPFVVPFLRAHLPLLQRELSNLARLAKQVSPLSSWEPVYAIAGCTELARLFCALSYTNPVIWKWWIFRIWGKTLFIGYQIFVKPSWRHIEYRQKALEHSNPTCTLLRTVNAINCSVNELTFQIQH